MFYQRQPWYCSPVRRFFISTFANLGAIISVICISIYKIKVINNVNWRELLQIKVSKMLKLFLGNKLVQKHLVR